MLGIEFVPNIPLSELVSHAVLAEECGFDAVWVTDHYNNRNPYVALSLLAEKTKKVKLGPGATNPYHIHPALTASAVASLDEASGGRAMLGVGAGDETTLNIRTALARGDYHTAFASVTDKMVNAFSIHGSPEHCLQRIHELYELGVTQVVIGSPIGPDKSAAIKLMGREIIPSLKKK